LPGSEEARQEALRLLLQLANEKRGTIEDERLIEVVSDDLVSAVFEIAWKHQWDPDPAAFSREARPLLESAVDKVVKAQ
jgi:hypothetical protein